MWQTKNVHSSQKKLKRVKKILLSWAGGINWYRYTYCSIAKLVLKCCEEAKYNKY